MHHQPLGSQSPRWHAFGLQEYPNGTGNGYGTVLYCAASAIKAVCDRAKLVQPGSEPTAATRETEGLAFADRRDPPAT